MESTAPLLARRWRKLARMTLLFAALPVPLVCGQSAVREYERHGKVIGQEITCRIDPNDSLFEVARRYGLGVNDIMAANPGQDPYVPDPDRPVVIPTAWILPTEPPRGGVVINLAEMRLYVFPGRGAHAVTTFPVGIGDLGSETPLGAFTIVEKVKNPPWFVPQSIRKEKPELPPVVPPGPDNPMGEYALRLSNQTVLIHGTDRPWGIGTRASHGCLRLYPEDIARLFPMVRVGTRVTIIDDPVKTTKEGERVLLEVHQYECERDLYGEALRVLTAANLALQADLAKVREATREHTGRLVDVTVGTDSTVQGPGTDTGRAALPLEELLR